jgi:hypothetical protein
MIAIFLYIIIIKYNVSHSTKVFVFCYYNNRPPDTPLMGMYTTGKYDKDVKIEKFKKPSASPVFYSI